MTSLKFPSDRWQTASAQLHNEVQLRITQCHDLKAHNLLQRARFVRHCLRSHTQSALTTDRNDYRCR